MHRDDFLVEIQTEELPPKSLLRLAQSFAEQMHHALTNVHLAFAEINYFATPCRLAVLVKKLNAKQADQVIERKGPAKNAAFDQHGHPTSAAIGFARSCSVAPADLNIIENEQGQWLAFQQRIQGKTVQELLPIIVRECLKQLPIPKKMYWRNGEAQFIRPIHHVVMMYGAGIIKMTLFGCESGQLTRGHRFLTKKLIKISHPSKYSIQLRKSGYVIADFSERREVIQQQINKCLARLNKKYQALIRPELLDEVTGLVEWPVAFCGEFDEGFLRLPSEVLISAMQDHQRYFPVIDENQSLVPYFIVVSNIPSKNPQQIIQGNQNVLRARLADASFFYQMDQKESLQERVSRLQGVLFQAKLGTLYDKTKRLEKIVSFITKKINVNENPTLRAASLAKTDLTTQMVNEFPELQGAMGYYYALHDQEGDDVALAVREHYLPRFSGDHLPKTIAGQVLAIADRIDTLVGTFGISKISTGDKDPYGLRRAALGVLRILLEYQLNIDLKELFSYAWSCYSQPLENKEALTQLLFFMQERMRVLFQEQGVGPDVFAAVAALGITHPVDAYARIKAVQAFKKLREANALSIANKRVSNIISKYKDEVGAQEIDIAFFEKPAEQELARQLDLKKKSIHQLCQLGKYEEVLFQLAELRQPIDDFFDQVMVMTDDKTRRENRILLLTKLRALFLQVADIALLQ